MTSAAAETPQADRDPHRMPYVRIVNKPKNPPPPGSPGTAMPGWRTKVYVDGVDMSAGVSDVKVTASLKDAVRATLEVFPVEVEFEGVVPEIGEVSRELLISLGWTPPDAA